jgi:hypothetical protein
MRTSEQKQEELREKVDRVMNSESHQVQKQGGDEEGRGHGFKVKYNPEHKDEFSSTYQVEHKRALQAEETRNEALN